MKRLIVLSSDARRRNNTRIISARSSQAPPSSIRRTALTWTMPAAMLAVLLIAPASRTAQGGPPRVEFDVTPVIECFDVSPPEFLADHPNERMVEAVIRTSSLFSEGDPADLIEFRYRMESPDSTAWIVDYEPKTELASEYASNISVEKKTESSRGLGVALDGAQSPLSRIHGQADIGTKEGEIVRYERLPRMLPVSSSGVLRGGFGVYFKLKSTDQTWLEGERLFRLTLRVPRAWRADYLRVQCEAVGRQKGLVRQLDDNVICGSVDTLGSLHLTGDPEARRAANWLASSRADLLHAASDHRNDIDRRRYPTLIHKFGAALDVVEPEIATDWLTQLVHASPGRLHSSFSNRLPVDVRVAALEFLEAKNDLYKLSGAAGDAEQAPNATASSRVAPFASPTRSTSETARTDSPRIEKGLPVNPLRPATLRSDADAASNSSSAFATSVE